MRKTRNKQVEEAWRKYLLHREFVRRNTQYGAFYRDCRSKWGEYNKKLPYWKFIHADWGLAEDEPLPDPNQRPDLNQILMKGSPKKGFPRIPYPGNMVFSKARDVFPIQEGQGPEKFERLKGLLFLTYFQEQTPRYPRIYVLDLSWPKVRLMKELELWVDWMLYERENLGLKQKTNEIRFRPNEYLEYLTVYDLRRRKWTFRRIGEFLWKNNLESGDIEKKAREFFKRAERLVNSPPLLSSQVI